MGSLYGMEIRMNKKCELLRRIITAWVLTVMLVLLPGAYVTPAQAADTFSFEKKKYTFTEGNMPQFSFKYNDQTDFVPDPWDYDTVTYSSSDTKVLDFNYWNEPVCKAPGVVKLTARYKGLKATCKVKVKESSYKLSVTEATIYSHQKLEVKMTGQKVKDVDYYVTEIIENNGNADITSRTTDKSGTFEISGTGEGDVVLGIYAYRNNGKREGKTLRLTLLNAGFDKSDYCVAKGATVKLKPANAKLKSLKVTQWYNEVEKVYFDCNSDPMYWKYDSYDDYDDYEEEFDEYEFAYEYGGLTLDDIEYYYYDWNIFWKNYDYDSWEDYLNDAHSESWWEARFWDDIAEYGENYEDYYGYIHYNEDYWAEWEEAFYYAYWDDYYYWFDTKEELEQFKRDNFSMYIDAFNSAKEAQKQSMDSYLSGYLPYLSDMIENYKSSYMAQHYSDQLDWETKHAEFAALKSQYDAQLQEYNTKLAAAKAQFEQEKNERKTAREQEKKTRSASMEEAFPFKVNQKGELTGVESGNGEIEAVYTVDTGEDITVTLFIEVTNPTKLNVPECLWVRDRRAYISAEGASWNSIYSIESKDESIVSTDPAKEKNVLGEYVNYDYYYYGNGDTVYPQKEGRTTLTVTVDGKVFTAEVYVIDPQIPDKDMIIVKKKAKNRAVTNLPEGMKVKYTSTDKSVVTVNKNGKVKPKKDGCANIIMEVGDRTFSYSVIVGFNLPTRAVAEANTVVGAKYSQDKRMQEGYYDCSSLVWRSYKAAGVALKSDSYAPTAADLCKFMEEEGYTISKKALPADKMKPGDIIFSSSSGDNGRYLNIDHVSMYMGSVVDDSGNVIGGKVIQAGSGGVYVSSYLNSYPTENLIVRIARIE